MVGLQKPITHESSRRFRQTKRPPMVACGAYAPSGKRSRMASVKSMRDPADGAAVLYTLADVDREVLPIV
jgi:hypothetical protein